MNSRSRKAQDNNDKQTSHDGTRYFLTSLLFLSALWAFFSRIMRSLGILPVNTLTNGSTTARMATRLSGDTTIAPEVLTSLRRKPHQPQTEKKTETSENKEVAEQTSAATPDSKERSVISPKL